MARAGLRRISGVGWRPTRRWTDRAEVVMQAPWDTTNPYAAMANNPVYFEDPDGENPVAGVATFAGSLWADVTRMGFQAARGRPTSS